MSNIITFLPSKTAVSVTTGTPLTDAFLVAGFLISSPCGGQGTCGRCKVLIKNGAAPATPCRHLSQTELDQGYRLACRTKIENDLTVIVPELPGETLILDRHKRKIEALPDQPLGSGSLGLAIDIGTTSVSVSLVKPDSGERLAVATDYNHQLPYGADIIHRIIFSQSSNGLSTLRQAIQETIIVLTGELFHKLGIDPQDIHSAAIAGNPTMIHLWRGLDPRFIREAPYEPITLSFPLLSGKETGLPINAEAQVVIAPGVANYLGGDITAGLLTTRFAQNEKPNLFLDLGTNGELVLGNREWLVGCACSCGPAFEGMGISCGMRAVPGAIDSFSLNGDAVKYTVLGGKKPAGFCGSGLIDCVAALFQNGLIDATGRINEEQAGTRFKQDNYGRKMICLVNCESTETESALFITENDLVNLVRTKAAIFAGVQSLLNSVELKLEDIGNVYISGGIGSHLDFHNAVIVGLLPPISEEHFIFLGNSSLKGAERLLVSAAEREQVDKLAAKMTYLDLSDHPGFMDEFTAACFLPHTNSALFTRI